MKHDILELFQDFYNGNLSVSRLNYGIITLLPKVTDAEKNTAIQANLPPKLSYKWITKVLTLILEPVAENLILPSETTFMKGRNTLTGVMALHEVLHETKRKKTKLELCLN